MGWLTASPQDVLLLSHFSCLLSNTGIIMFLSSFPSHAWKHSSAAGFTFRWQVRDAGPQKGSTQILTKSKWTSRSILLTHPPLLFVLTQIQAGFFVSLVPLNLLSLRHQILRHLSLPTYLFALELPNTGRLPQPSFPREPALEFCSFSSSFSFMWPASGVEWHFKSSLP